MALETAGKNAVDGASPASTIFLRCLLKSIAEDLVDGELMDAAAGGTGV